MEGTTLVIGSTGLVGYSLTQALLRKNRPVRLMVRDPEKARAMFPEVQDIARGDLTDPASIDTAVSGADVVYHAGGLPEQWFKDGDIFQRVNVAGTANVIASCLKHKVRRLMYVSTIDVFEGRAHERYDETILDPNPKQTLYEASKQEADRLVVDALGDGLPAVFLHPSAVYGLGPATSPGVNDLIVDLNEGKVPMLLPGGLPLVFTEDLTKGFLLAEEKASIGERYIFCESYQTLVGLVRAILPHLGRKRVPPVMPVPVARLVSSLGQMVSNITGKPPLIPKGQLHFLQWQAIPDSRKAKEQLGWEPTPFAEGLARTIEELRRQKRI